jgi:type II secretory pathway pseudopilin PulG
MINQFREAVARVDGFSLVEIVVSMFLLTAISLALIPALIAGLGQSAKNALISSATQIVETQTEAIRTQSSTCAAVSAFAAVVVPEVVDSRGTHLKISKVISSCPARYPGTIRFEVTVLRVDTGETLVKAATLVFVSGAN